MLVDYSSDEDDSDEDDSGVDDSGDNNSDNLVEDKDNESIIK